MRLSFTFLLSLALTTFSANAQSVSEQQALDIAQQFMGQTVHRNAPSSSKASLQMVKKAVNTQGETDYYVFNREDKGGFVVVSGNELTTPVWAYSDTETFTNDDMPENVAWWLGEYQRQLQYLRQHPEAARLPKKLSSSVAPLMTTTWKQGSPYNSEIPSIRYSLGTAKPVVGCVALAMAQMMKAHNWPDHGEGSHSYTYRAEGATSAKEFSANFAATNYQWSSMKDSYGSSQDATAAATLCYHAGVAVDMQYNTADNGGSGAQIYDAMKALRTYFRYDKGLDLYLRDFYPIDTWEQMLRDDIDQGNPIIYGGSTVNMYGHCFVFDGYDSDGRFHINWGWGGDYNGYFVSSILDSGRANADFSSWQQAILGAKPDYDGTSTGAALRPLTGYLINLSTQQSQVRVGGSVGLVIEGITFLGEGSYNLNYCGVRVYTEDEQTVIKDEWQADCSQMKVGESYAIDETAALEIPSNIADGVYHIYAVYALDDENATQPIRYERPPSKAKYIKMEVKNGYAYFSDGDTEPVAPTPTISASPLSLEFEGTPNEIYTKSISVRGANLEGDINATLTTTDTDVFAVSQAVIHVNEAANGVTLTVTYAPKEEGAATATLTLSSENAQDVIVDITGNAKDEQPHPVEPSLQVNPFELEFQCEEGDTESKSFTVLGTDLQDNVALTIEGDNVFSLSTTTIPVEEVGQVGTTVMVTFAPETAGSYHATVTITSGEAESLVVTLTGEATSTTPLPTSDASYLNIANHALIGETATTPDGMSTIYRYTEYPERQEGVLTLSAWGAWQNDEAQNWYDIDALYSFTTRWEANADGDMLGYEAYFNSGAKVIDSESTETFYVTNCTQARAYGHNYSALTAVQMEVFECTETEDGIVVAATPIDIQEGEIRSEFLLASTTLDPSKIYMVRLVNKNSEVYEFAFATPLNGETPQTPTAITSTPDTQQKLWIGSSAGSQNSAFDLQGRATKNARTSGILIVGGRKVVIK